MQPARPRARSRTQVVGRVGSNHHPGRIGIQYAAAVLQTEANRRRAFDQLEAKRDRARKQSTVLSSLPWLGVRPTCVFKCTSTELPDLGARPDAAVSHSESNWADLAFVVGYIR